MSIASLIQHKAILLFVIVFFAGILSACGPSQADIDATATAQAASVAATTNAAVAQTVAAQAAVDAAVALTVAAQAPTDLSLAGDAAQTGDIAQTTVLTTTANVGAVDPAVPVPVDASIPQLSIPKPINVRSGPGTAYSVVGTLPAGAVVNVIAKNQAGDWFNILMPDSVTKGWVAASLTTAVSEPAMTTVQVAATIPALPTATATATKAATSVATHTPAPTSASGHTATPTTTHNATHTPTMPPMPTQLTKTGWQVDFLFLGGSDRLQVQFTQTGDVLSGSNRDNNAELDIVTTGTVTGNTVVVTFTLSNGGSPRGSVTCTGTIDAGPPQTISGTFTAPTKDGVGGTDGSCNFR